MAQEADIEMNDSDAILEAKLERLTKLIDTDAKSNIIIS